MQSILHVCFSLSIQSCIGGTVCKGFTETIQIQFWGCRGRVRISQIKNKRIYTFFLLNFLISIRSTLKKAWLVLKAELFHRSKAHSDFAAKVNRS